MSKKLEEVESIEAQYNDDDFVDINNLEALEEATVERVGKFPLILKSGKKILLRYKVMDFAHGLEASRGERFKENEVNDPDKTRRIFIKKINMGLLDGWKVVDNIGRKLSESSGKMLFRKVIPIDQFTGEDWNTLNQLMFPGALDQSEDIKNRANAIADFYMPEVPGVGNSNPGRQKLLQIF